MTTKLASIQSRLAPVMQEVFTEIHKAELRYGDPVSTHESMGVLAEEWDELREAIRANDLQATRQEAIQIASVAIRLAYTCDLKNLNFASRSGIAWRDTAMETLA